MSYKQIHDMPVEEQVNFYCEMIYRFRKYEMMGQPMRGANDLSFQSRSPIDHYDFDAWPADLGVQSRESGEVTAWDIRQVLDRYKARGIRITSDVEFAVGKQIMHKVVAMNPTTIPDDIFDYAWVQGLEYEQTGGGCDFIVAYPLRSIQVVDPKTGKEFTTPQVTVDLCYRIVLSDLEDEGSSPELLTSPALLTFYIDNESEEGLWDRWISVPGGTAKQAIDRMAKAKAGHM